VRLAKIFRHPVKGLRPEELFVAELNPGRGVAGDRSFAFQFMDNSVPVDLRASAPESTPWMSKAHLAVQHDWPELAQWVPHLDFAAQKLRLEGPRGLCCEESFVTPAGRDALALAIFNFLQTCTPFARARHPLVTPLRMIGAADQSSRYTDGNAGPVTLVSLGTLRDLERLSGISVDPRRFRMNLILEGPAALEEQSWVGRRLQIGDVVLEVTKPVGRCANIDVNPETGARDADILAKLLPNYGHGLVGMRAEVVAAGNISTGDKITLL